MNFKLRVCFLTMLIFISSCATSAQMGAIRKEVNKNKLEGVDGKTKFGLSYPSSHSGAYESVDILNFTVSSGKFKGKNASALLGKSHKTGNWEVLRIMIESNGIWVSLSKVEDNNIVNLGYREKTVKNENTIIGNWLGILNITKTRSLRITFTITKKDNKLIGKLGSPDQMAMNIPIDEIKYDDNILDIKVDKFQINFKGKLDEGMIKGEFIQKGMKFTLELTKLETVKNLVKKYKQMPKKPYPYIEEEVSFINKQKNIEFLDPSKKIEIKLSGTLTYPKTSDKNKKFPAIILIAGSGPNDRNETPMKHFLYISNKLTKQGYAVLRFDKRGIKKSRGDYKNATTYDFADDVGAAIDYLLSREIIDKEKIGLLGHSEGAMIAPIVASFRKDIKFLILMGTLGVDGMDGLIKQAEDVARVSGVNEKKIMQAKEINKKVYSLVKESRYSKKIDAVKNKLIKISPNVKSQMNILLSPWFVTFLNFKPSKYLEKITIPTLVLSGEKDIQVNPILNNKAIKKALDKANNKNYEIKTFKNLNHLFQTSKTGNPNEYGKLDEIMNEKVMEYVKNWLKTIK